MTRKICKNHRESIIPGRFRPAVRAMLEGDGSERGSAFAMPPDIRGCVHKFVPSNAALSNVVIQVLKSVFQASSLPLPLVKLVVERALEQSRTMEMKVDSTVFIDKLTIYANQLRPRFLSQINDIRKRGKKW